MTPFVHEAKLRFHHMDRAGMVFHGAYVELFQDAFEELLEHTGHVEKELEGSLGVRLPVVEHRMGFPAPPEGDRLSIAVTIERLGHASATFHMEARDASGRICAEATVVRVCIGEQGHSVDIPGELREAWAPYVKATETGQVFGG